MSGLLDFLQSASNSVASNVTAPVDGIAWLLRKAGIPVPDAPVGGSDWAQNAGLTRPVQQSGASLAGESLGMIAPMLIAAKAPQVARGLLQAGENAMVPRTLNPQTGAIVWHGSPVRQPFVYPQDKALATAQRNAALPIEQGGLGLGPENTAMERARALGFTDDAFHGTDRDFAAFQANGGTGKTHGTGAFFSDNPSVASTYAGRESGSVVPSMLRVESPVVVDANGQNWNYLGKSTKINAPKITVADKEGDALMADLFGDTAQSTIDKKAFKKTLGKLWPDEFRFSDSASTDDLARWANKEGYGSMVFGGVKDRGPSGTFANAESAIPSKNTVMFNPANIRSRFAVFDPMRRNEADLLGRADPELLGLLSAGLLGYGGYNALSKP